VEAKAWFSKANGIDLKRNMKFGMFHFLENASKLSCEA
jgi:hypothetical protein